MITPEEAEVAARERDKDKIETVAAVIADVIKKQYVPGQPVTITIAKSTKRGRGSIEVSRFLLDAALERFAKPSDNGMYWSADVTEPQPTLTGEGDAHVPHWYVEMTVTKHQGNPQR